MGIVYKTDHLISLRYGASYLLLQAAIGLPNLCGQAVEFTGHGQSTPVGA